MQYAGIAALVAFLLSACTGEPSDVAPPPPMPDAGVTEADSQADPPPAAGLNIRFESRPSFENGAAAAIDDGMFIDRATLSFTQVRIIGDSAAGTDRTSADHFEIEWGNGRENILTFPQAPPGIYSKLLGQIDAFRIEGRVTCEAEQTEKPFVLDASNADAVLEFDIGGEVLEPGMERAVTVLVKLGEVVTSFDWCTIAESDDGSLIPDEDLVDEANQTLEQSFEKGPEEEPTCRVDCEGADGGGGDEDGAGDGDGSDDGSGDQEPGKGGGGQRAEPAPEQPEQPGEPEIPGQPGQREPFDPGDHIDPIDPLDPVDPNDRPDPNDSAETPYETDKRG